jgi:6-phosphogluconolactonase
MANFYALSFPLLWFKLSTMDNTEIKVVPDPKALCEEAARRIITVAEAKLADNQHYFSLVLSGGSTPKALYEMLAAEPYRSQLNWSRVEIYFGDERCVPPDHPDSNFLMANTAMLSKLPMPDANIHRMRGELSPAAAAMEYGQLLKQKFADGGPDMVLLGMGDEGHTASLFPGTEALKETHHRCVANFVPKLNAWRITMTYPFINRSQTIMMLIAGQNKAATIEQVLEGPRHVELYPIQGIRPTGKLIWLLDVAAASMHH